MENAIESVNEETMNLTEAAKVFNVLHKRLMIEFVINMEKLGR